MTSSPAQKSAMAYLRRIAPRRCRRFMMPENAAQLEGEISPERRRYQLLLEITDLVARAKSLPDAFKALAPPVLALTAGELLNLSLHSPHRHSMLTNYWKKNQERREVAPFPADRAAR